METLPNGFTLDIPPGCFPLSTDSMVLAHFAGQLGARTVLDLCAGCGTIGLLLCAENPGCTVTGLELEEGAHSAALANIERNHLHARMNSICADVRQVPGLLAPGSFSCCISNPPYFADGPASAARIARREDTCTLSDLFRAASWALKYGGDFFLVHRPERLGEIIAQGSAMKLEAKRLGLVRHKADGPVTLVLLQMRKGGRPGLKLEDLILHHADGSPTPLYRKIYHIPEE